MLDWSRYREFTDPLPTRDIVTDSPEETVNALNSAILIALLEQSNDIPCSDVPHGHLNSIIGAILRRIELCGISRIPTALFLPIFLHFLYLNTSKSDTCRIRYGVQPHSKNSSCQSSDTNLCVIFWNASGHYNVVFTTETKHCTSLRGSLFLLKLEQQMKYMNSMKFTATIIHSEPLKRVPSGFFLVNDDAHCEILQEMWKTPIGWRAVSVNI
ncbi:hypothetical protein TNCT_666201 [Trichonephila clavata]|uniref:Uncharacterized protein n=1 Tax=Trichonephila clavata TaxID=2740835 RepID=A0A8X6GYM9_TRICU|nr:hypothetical protein TNCT_666201 [Trichonephila clavata]